MPDLDALQEHERGQSHDRDGRGPLADEDEPSWVEAVGESSGEEVEDDGGYSLSGGDESEGDFLAGHVVDEPSLGSEERLVGGDAGDESEPVAAVVPSTEDGEELEAWGKGGAHCDNVTPRGAGPSNGSLGRGCREGRAARPARRNADYWAGGVRRGRASRGGWERV